MVRQAYSLDVLLTEVNTHAPNRSKASDGGLGDDAHASRDSDHNPNEYGVWRARDFTNDPQHGFDCADFSQRVAAKLGHHQALMSGAYVIWNRRIISYDRRSEGWRTYTGANPHDKHCHVSVSTKPSGYDNREPWNLWEPKMSPGEKFKTTVLAACTEALRDGGIPVRRRVQRRMVVAIRAIARKFPTP